MVDVSNVEGFDWDDGNRSKNKIKHDVDTFEAEEIFFNIPLILLDDVKHSQEESRYHALGQTNQGRELHITFTIRDNKIRVISARNMHRKERKTYGKIKEEEDSLFSE